MHVFTRCKRDPVYCTTNNLCTFVDRKRVVPLYCLFFEHTDRLLP